jgi:hypothetical protein
MEYESIGKAEQNIGFGQLYAGSFPFSGGRGLFMQAFQKSSILPFLLGTKEDSLLTAVNEGRVLVDLKVRVASAGNCHKG